MIERWIQRCVVDDPGSETLAETRARLRPFFSPLASRRMTQLGMLVGATVRQLPGATPGAIVYATSYGESRALESYLDSFPNPSPTLFQTSIHPSGVQQGLIGKQTPVPELFPLSGGQFLGGHALATACLNEAADVVLCGGEERGTYLLEKGVASDRTYAFALALSSSRGTDSIGQISLEATDDSAGLDLPQLFDLLRHQRAFNGTIAPGWRAAIAWQ